MHDQRLWCLHNFLNIGLPAALLAKIVCNHVSNCNEINGLAALDPWRRGSWKTDDDGQWNFWSNGECRGPTDERAGSCACR